MLGLIVTLCESVCDMEVVMEGVCVDEGDGAQDAYRPCSRTAPYAGSTEKVVPLSADESAARATPVPDCGTCANDASVGTSHSTGTDAENKTAYARHAAEFTRKSAPPIGTST